MSENIRKRVEQVGEGTKNMGEKKLKTLDLQISSKLLGQNGCKEEACAQSQLQINVGAGAGLSSQSQVNIGAGPRLSSQDDGVPQQQETATLILPQFNRLIEASFVRDESSTSNADSTAVPSQHRVTQQILSHWQPFQDLKLMFAGSRRTEQLSLRSQYPLLQANELAGADQASPSG